ncbi:MAG: hypothetical protein WC829_02265 [Hyphomicrobium sp.]|jgi:hypothetical protein
MSISKRQRIEKAMTSVANMIERYNEPRYLPIFERLETMLAEEMQKGDALARARKMVADQHQRI